MVRPQVSLPADGSSSPSSRRISVVLPMPLRPTMPRRSPRSMRVLNLVTRLGPPGWPKVTFSTLMTSWPLGLGSLKNRRGRDAAGGHDLLPGELGDLLLAAGRLLGARGVRLEALDEELELLDLALDAAGLLAALGARELLLRLVDVVAAVEDADGLVVDVAGQVADAVEEVAVVADHDDHALVVGEELLQPHHRRDVEVVGRLVEQQHVGLGEQRLGEQHAHLQRAVDVPQVLVVDLGRHAEVGEDLGGVALLRVAVELLELLLELAQARAVGVREVGLGGERGHLGLQLPDHRVAHHHHVEHAHVVAARDVLLEPAHALAGLEEDLPGGLLQLAGEDLEEGRLAGAVRADQAIAVAGGELQADVLEQHLLAEGHAEGTGGDHDGSNGGRGRDGRALCDQGRGGEPYGRPWTQDPGPRP